MKYRLLSALAIMFLIIFLGITIVKAYSASFTFSKLGDLQEVTGYLSKGDETLDVKHDGSLTFDTLGLSLSKKTLFSYSFISRCDYRLTGTDKVTCTWKDRDQGNYKGTVVMSDMPSKGDVKGTIDLYTSVIKQ